MFRHRNKIIGFLICLGILVSAGFVFAQPDLGLTNEFANQAGLGTKPLGQTIAEIVRVFLSVLGILAVILLLYAGFLWMTAAGDATKIATAKKIMINAVIGLAIILSSLAITQFIIGALSAATGTNIEAIGGGPGGGGGLPSDAFTVRGISPQGKIPIRNVVVRIGLNHNPDVSTINGNVLIIRKSDNGLAPYTFAMSNNTIELTSSIGCPAPNDSVKCFDADTVYKVEVKTGLKDTGGKDLTCGGFAPNCTAEFTTGSMVDTAPPQVAVTYPDPGQSVSQNSMVPVWAKATDDSAVSNIDFFADGAYFDKAFPSGPSPAIFDGKVFWDTTAVVKGSHNLSAKAYDIDSNSAFSAPLSVTVRAEHCFNGAKDADEIGADCGGADCAACSGGACTQNSDCASMSCQNGVCVDTPIILSVSPLDGAPGTYVTIAGKYFGATPGTVTFLGGAGTADDKVANLAPCGGAWSNTQVVVVVPQGITTNGPIEIKNSIGADTTDNFRGPVLPNFVISPTLRPGICSLTPNEGKSGTTFTIAGTEFGAAQGTSFIKFGKVFAVPQTWSNKSITALVPVLSAGDNSVQVSRDGVDSNAIIFTVLSLTSGTKPVINYVNPDAGPAGEYITLFGSNFGDGNPPGVVQFVRSDGTVALGDTNFPQVCAAVSYWHNGYVTVKIPEKFSDGSSTKNVAVSLRLRRFDNEISNVLSFSINSDTPKPGICGLNPDNGPIGTAVNILGERFGAGGAATFYNNVSAVSVWGSEMVQTAVPAGAVSGPVKITVAGKDSNSVNFSVGDCGKTPALCGVDQQCCAASCIPKKQICLAASKEGAYAWHISTGIIPRVPHVVEDCSTGDKAASPSPSPWDAQPGGNTVCVNAIVNIHFDSKLDPSTIIMSGLSADTLALYKCTGAAPDSCAAKAKVALDPANSGVYSVNATDGGVQLYPAGGKLEKDTQYLVELTTKIRGAGAGGGYMEEKIECGIGNSYCFKFKTINSDGLCKVGSLVTSPQDYTSDKKELLEYISSPRAKDDVCLNINASPYTYAWSSSQLFPPNHANINKIGFNLAGQPVQNEAVIESLSETNPGDPAIITSAILSENVSGKANLTIKFADPVVVSKWPSCTTACVNSTIGAQFNVDMDAATLIPANIEVWKCKTENCDNFDGTITGSISYSAANKSFTFVPSAPLEISRYYLARLDAQKIRSTSGVGLTGANSGIYYTWQFKTRADITPCTVNKINVNPASQSYNYIGQIAEFDSEPLGAPDNCSPVGQRLNPYTYGWAWQSAAPVIVSLLNNGNYNVLPPAGAGCNDKCLRTGSKPGVSVCGNGKLEKGESCDDNNAENGDGCSDRCLAEGATAMGSKAGKSICGNGDIGNGETCDDGNAVSGDGCSNDCLNEGTDSGIASCGNGVAEKNMGEDCDDGNTNSGDGCSANCLNEGSVFAFAKYGSICGENGIETGEDCDDGNTNSGDGCSSNCLNEGSNLYYNSVCGNGAVEKGESCDNSSADGRIDPRQYASAVNKGETQISAATAGITGKSNVEVLCVYTTDLQCQAFGPDLGVGKDNCCYERPGVILTIPKFSETGVCRNTLIGATFNQLMDGAAGEISIDQKKNGNCPGGSTVSADGVWCLGAIKATRSANDDAKNNQTEFSWNISNLLEAGKTYRVQLTNFKNKGGVAQAGNSFFWTFAAGDDVCKIDQVKVSSDPTIFYNTKPVSPGNPDGSPQQAQAIAISLKSGNPLSSIPGIYAWDWHWDTFPKQYITLTPSAFPETVSVTALPKNGEETLSATASSTADKFNINTEKLVTGTARVIVFLCENPWPGLTSFPWTDPTPPPLNVSAYYCRDTGSVCKDGKCTVGINSCLSDDDCLLPNLTIVPVTVPAAADIVKEYLFTNSATGDAVGLRVYRNLSHLSPLAWYSEQFVGNPSATQVDGYEAIVDGRTTYVNAANHIGPNYTNMFVVSYNQAAPAEIQNIYKQLLENWRFNTNLISINIRKCQASGKACVSDLDCGAGDECLADKDKVRRDVKRLADLNDIAALLETYKTKNNGLYPQILAGSFLRGWSVSVWPSWQAALGNDLGKAVAADPVNKHAECKSPYNPVNCWDGAAGKYTCPAGSHVYRYQNLGGTDYRLATDFEYLDKDWISLPDSRVSISNSCTAGVVFGTSSVCGDGVVGAGETCEKGQFAVEQCPGTSNQFRKLTCSASCTWTAGACTAGQCGDGVKQTNEVCDDGQNNGRYGYCNASCGGLADNCGDEKVNGSEQCDLGAANGQYNVNYNASCSWDCKKPGPSCGDKIVQSNEQCDGNSETSKTVARLPACTVRNGYETQRTRNCAASCTWDIWSDCKAKGECGNGIQEGTEACDTGSSGTSGACVMDILKTPTPYACKNAVCGDGYVRTNKEACDNGILNGKECNAPYGLTCNYCGISCAVITKTGDYCGDGKKNGPEECDGSDFGDATCRNYGFLEFSGENHLSCAANCKADVSWCASIFRANAGGPTWTDPNGNVWFEDIKYNNTPNALYSGSDGTWSSVVPIGGTELDTLYQTERFSNSNLAYNFNIGPGQYRVRLHFAEIYLVSTNANVRVSNIKGDPLNIKGEPTVYEYNFDLPKLAGLNTALVKEYTIEVKDSALNISLEKSGGTKGPKLSAIEVELTGGAVSSGAPPSCTDQCSSGQKKCDGAWVATCVQQGGCWAWQKASTACFGTCSNGTCVSTPPPPPPCTSNCSLLGDTRCVGTTQQETCGSVSGGCLQWKDRITCGISCSGKTCTKPACLDGAKQTCSYSYGNCVRNGTQTCTGGVWGACTYVASQDPRIATCNTAAACASDGCGGMCSTSSKCPSPPQCNQYICSNFSCLLVPANEGGKCTSGALTLTCRNGKCTF